LIEIFNFKKKMAIDQQQQRKENVEAVYKFFKFKSNKLSNDNTRQFDQK